MERFRCGLSQPIPKRRGQSIALVAWIIILVLLCFHDSYAQIRDLAGTRYAVRALMTEPTSTYLADTILNKVINIAHRTTLQLLGDETLVGVDTVITSNGTCRYTINSDASKITGVVKRLPERLGKYDVALAEIPPASLGKINQGAAPEFYYETGGFLVLGQSPEGDDTLFVYYVPYARNLDTDTTQLQMGTEDHQAVVWLAASQIAMRDRQLELADRLFGIWKNYVDWRTGRLQGPPTTAP